MSEFMSEWPLMISVVRTVALQLKVLAPAKRSAEISATVAPPTNTIYQPR